MMVSLSTKINFLLRTLLVMQTTLCTQHDMYGYLEWLSGGGCKTTVITMPEYKHFENKPYKRNFEVKNYTSNDKGDFGFELCIAYNLPSWDPFADLKKIKINRHVVFNLFKQRVEVAGALAKKERYNREYNLQKIQLRSAFDYDVIGPALNFDTKIQAKNQSFYLTYLHGFLHSFSDHSFALGHSETGIFSSSYDYYLLLVYLNKQGKKECLPLGKIACNLDEEESVIFVLPNSPMILIINGNHLCIVEPKKIIPKKLCLFSQAFDTKFCYIENKQTKYSKE